MTKVIKCDCGYIVRGETDDELTTAAQQHAPQVHDMDLSKEQVLAMAEPA